MDLIPGYSRIQQHEVLRGSGVSEWDQLPARARANLLRWAEAYRTIRDTINARIRVASGYRTPAVNAACGGEKRSQHLAGLAGDIYLVGRTSSLLQSDMRELYLLIDRMQADGRIPPGGIGAYAGKDPETHKRTEDWIDFVHFDIRGHRSRWNGDTFNRLIRQ